MSLSVFIPTYNCGHYIAETIESVLSQAVPCLKLIVVDNCSTDNTEQVVSQYINSGVTYIKQPINIGVTQNHNFCLDIADTDFIKLLSADDVLLPNILNLQLEALKSNQDCGIATCDYFITDSNLNIIANSKVISGKLQGHKAIKLCATKVQNLIGGPSMTMLRRDFVGQNRFNENFKWSGDLLFFCDILEKSNLINVGVKGVLYRRHEQTDSELNCTKPIRLNDEIYLKQKFAQGKIEPHLRLLKRYKIEYLKKLLNIM